MLRAAKIVTVAVLLAILVVRPSAAAEEDGARAVVAGFQQGLLGAMKDARTLGIKGRADRLMPFIETAFNLPVMIATASAPFWQGATAEQRAALVESFSRMSIASAATLFDSYSGETFRIAGTRKGNGPTLLVDTQIVRPKRDPVNITYVAANIRGRWWIVDIIVGGGISELTVRRSEYQSILKEGGVASLVATLSRKAENLLAGKEKAAPAGGS